jgi:tryptophan halogenase
MAYQYDHIRDFIIMHYCLTDREDSPFWQANKYQLTLPDSLQMKLALWRTALPIQEDSLEAGFFRTPSYACILSGLGCLPKRALPILNHLPPTQAEATFDRIQMEAEHWRQKLPDHTQTLRRLQLYHELRQAYRAEKDNQP